MNVNIFLYLTTHFYKNLKGEVLWKVKAKKKEKRVRKMLKSVVLAR